VGKRQKYKKNRICGLLRISAEFGQSLGCLESPPPLNASLTKGCPFLLFLSILFVLRIKSVHLGYAGIVFLVSEVRAAARAVQHTFCYMYSKRLAVPPPPRSAGPARSKNKASYLDKIKSSQRFRPVDPATSTKINQLLSVLFCSVLFCSARGCEKVKKQPFQEA
jgi:hypothetical protein